MNFDNTRNKQVREKERNTKLPPNETLLFKIQNFHRLYQYHTTNQNTKFSSDISVSTPELLQD